MPHKHLMFHADAREKILRGATAIADAMCVTLGPKSKCVLIERRWGQPIVCNDGVGAFGLDASTGRYVDLIETGIIDPTKVVRLALENAYRPQACCS